MSTSGKKSPAGVRLKKRLRTMRFGRLCNTLYSRSLCHEVKNEKNRTRTVWTGFYLMRRNHRTGHRCPWFSMSPCVLSDNQKTTRQHYRQYELYYMCIRDERNATKSMAGALKKTPKRALNYTIAHTKPACPSPHNRPQTVWCAIPPGVLLIC